MKRAGSLICFVVIFTVYAGAQAFTDSNLPIVIINTDGAVNIPDSYRILATMKIIDRGPGERNYLTDQDNPEFLGYNGRIDIETRGSSSQDKPKKQYGFTTLQADNLTNNNVSLLGMPSENDWILNGMVWDPGYIRDYLCFNLSRQLGEYASRTVYCEVVVNGNYRGLYLLTEKIKADNNRVDVIKIEPADNFSPVITGGYITKADKLTGGDPVAWTMTGWQGYTVNYIHHLPKPENVTTEQHNYIKNYFFGLANAAIQGDRSLATGYPSLIDIPSFISYMIISELSSNADSYSLSTYFHKDRNGKLRAGPVWDSDLTFGNDLFIYGYDRSKTDVWQFSDGGNDGSRFWRDLFLESRFRCYLSKKWNGLLQPGELLDQVKLNAFIDETVSHISEAVTRDKSRWSLPGSYSQNIELLKAWLSERITWITANIGPWSGCSSVALPSLVISKIMYNPPASLWFPDGEDLEFLEISNTGPEEADLSGVYFGGTGFVYLFPYGITILPDTSYFLASNRTIFEAKYGFRPFDEFTRHISNAGQDLMLLDALGNVIDMVQFSDTIPWPEADGNGSYLKLISTALDNNLPESWIAANEVIYSTDDTEADDGLLLGPNPVREVLYLNSERFILTVGLFDAAGRRISSEKVNSHTHIMQMGHLPAGIYFVKVDAGGKIITKKVILL
ncbi:MAG: CotH kinase family protein [Bacteroidales bacterium]|nr:CotH kinase family protein [Bacteroidales bacterium]